MLYYLFYQLENWVVSIGYPPGAGNFYEIFPDPGAIDQKMRDVYYGEMKWSVKAWTGIGDTIHLTVFIVCGIAGRLSYVFPVILIGTNCWMAFALFLQRTKFRRFQSRITPVGGD